jgi:hypothetical protein
MDDEWSWKSSKIAEGACRWAVAWPQRAAACRLLAEEAEKSAKGLKALRPD